MKIVAFILLIPFALVAQISSKLQLNLDQQTQEVEKKLIEWRRNFHQFPELSNQEIKTAGKIAWHLRSLGFEIKTGIAHTGVVGVLNTGKPGPVIALRADMDALPVTEHNGLPFASKEKTIFNEKETGIMHACGHDAHMAILMAVAEVLAKNKDELRGIIKFIFQPAEEGAGTVPGGAKMMVDEGVLENPHVDAIFGLHIQSTIPVGTIAYRPGGFMAAPDFFTIKVKGKGAHGSTPWDGIDPIVVGSQIIMGLQTIISRQTELTKDPAVITIGRFNSGIRENIIPEEAVMSGTIRTFDKKMQADIYQRIKITAENIAQSAGASAEVMINPGAPVTFNDLALTEKMLPSLQRAVGKENTKLMNPFTMGEDFSYFQEKVPGLFFFIGGMAPGTDPKQAPIHHTQDFMIDENGMKFGVKALLNLTVDYMFPKPSEEVIVNKKN